MVDILVVAFLVEATTHVCVVDGVARDDTAKAIQRCAVFDEGLHLGHRLLAGAGDDGGKNAVAPHIFVGIAIMEGFQSKGVFHGLVPYFLVHQVEEQDAVTVFLHLGGKLRIFFLQMGIGIVHHGLVGKGLVKLIGVG